MFDLIIRNAKLVDGTGAPARQADIAVKDGKITEIGAIDAKAKTEIDAKGDLVTPGWVDIDADGCDVYEEFDFCGIAEDFADESGVSALEACCYCGGGS